MKVLILSITAGQGHHATGRAISGYLKSQGVQCATLDTYEYVAPIVKEAVDKGYLLNVAYTPMLFGKIYRLAERKSESKLQSPFFWLKYANNKFATEMQELIEEYQPDVIICTHVLAAVIVNVLKRRGQIHAITVGIITDFTMHPFWEDAADIDYFVTGSEYLGYRLSKKGLDSAKMLPFGIPIDPKFSQKIDQKEARRRLGIDTEKKTVLIMGGSMGHGHIDQVIMDLDQLNFDFQILVICGNNKHILAKVSNLTTKKTVKSFAFVHNVEEFMDASDCIISKPGGLTSSEALAKGLPMVMINPIPGQEERNVEFLLNMGLALAVTHDFPVAEAVYCLLVDEHRRMVLEENIRQLGKTNSAKRLGDFLIEQISVRSGNN